MRTRHVARAMNKTYHKEIKELASPAQAEMMAVQFMYSEDSEMSQWKACNRRFTLIERLIVVAIIGHDIPDFHARVLAT